MQHEGLHEPARPRRVKIKGQRGIYYREGASGRRRYEITYLDSDGRRRWQVVEGGLKEAQAAIEDTHTKLRRGERVAPTRATFGEIADLWLASQSELRPRTRAAYESALRVHLLPRFRRLRIADITEDHIAVLIADMRKRGYAGWTIRAALTPLGRILGHAARRGLIGQNPMGRLERGERPSVNRQEMRVLDREEITALLGAADTAARPLLATAIFTGLRLGELLALTWANMDFDGGVLHVRRQLDRTGERVEPKTGQAVRDVVLMPALARTLREHRLRSPHSGEEDLVFPSAVGAGLDHTIPRRMLARAVRSAELDVADKPKLRFHDLRHTFASIVIAQGQNVVFVSRQLGHSSPDITLKVYAHLFDLAQHASQASAALEAGFGKVLEMSGGEQAQAVESKEAPTVPFPCAFR